MTYSSDETRQSIELYHKGKSLEAIGSAIGRDKRTVRNILTEAGITIRPKFNHKPNHTLTAFEVLAIYGYRAELEPKEIAYRLGYKDRQSGRDLLRSAFEKIRARTPKEEQQ